MLLIVKISVDEIGKKKSRQKGKHPLPFENWIFRNGHDDNCRIVVAMTSTLEHNNPVQIAFAPFPQNYSAVDNL